jgi:hypothetical protein
MRVESRRGRVPCTVPFPLPAHRTQRADFPHYALRLISSQGTRCRAKMNSTKPKHAKFAMHHSVREAADASRRHLVTPDQEMTDAVIDVVVDRPVGDQAGTIVEIRAPATQQTVQLVSHLGPRRLIAGRQDLANLTLEPLYALLGRARPQIPVAVLPIVMRSERITKEVKVLLPSIPDRGFRLVDRETELRPASSGCRSAIGTSSPY